MDNKVTKIVNVELQNLKKDKSFREKLSTSNFLVFEYEHLVFDVIDIEKFIDNVKNLPKEDKEHIVNFPSDLMQVTNEINLSTDAYFFIQEVEELEDYDLDNTQKKLIQNYLELNKDNTYEL